MRGEPTNFLIDQNGRIVFTSFRADDPNGGQREVELMVEALLQRSNRRVGMEVMTARPVIANAKTPVPDGSECGAQARY